MERNYCRFLKRQTNSNMEYRNFENAWRYNDRYISKEHKKALIKNENLVGQLNNARKNALGIGTNKIKRRLNLLSKENQIALALRIALEIEDKNILAKKSYGKYKSKIYETKKILINNLIDVFVSNGWCFGKHISDGIETNHIIYFEIPNCEQISFHTDLEKSVPDYNKMWDGKISSTIPKLLDAIVTNFPDINKT